MSVVRLLVDVLGPVVVIVGIGAYVGRRLTLDIDTLSRLAYWVLGPAFVFEIFLENQLAGGTAFRLVAAGLAGMVVAGVVTFAVSRAMAAPGPTIAADVMTASYGNVGNTGLAVTAFALGDDALAAARVLMLTINITGMASGIAMAASQKYGLGGVAKRALLAPMTIGAAAAIALNAAGVNGAEVVADGIVTGGAASDGTALPLVIDRAVGLAAAAMIPVMLLALGMQLAATGWRPPTAGLGLSTVAKLVIAPIAAVAVGSMLGLDGDNLGAVAIQSAMPPAVFCLIVAREHGLEADRVTTSVVTMTALSLLTLPVVLVLAVP